MSSVKTEFNHTRNQFIETAKMEAYRHRVLGGRSVTEDMLKRIVESGSVTKKQVEKDLYLAHCDPDVDPDEISNLEWLLELF